MGLGMAVISVVQRSNAAGNHSREDILHQPRRTQVSNNFHTTALLPTHCVLFSLFC